jgi:hypothetical protein
MILNPLLKKIGVTVIVFVLVCLSMDLLAQCPMCKIAAESNLENGGTAGKGLNKGILYIFVLPYLLVTTLGYIWWKSRKNPEYDDVAKWN